MFSNSRQVKPNPAARLSPSRADRFGSAALVIARCVLLSSGDLGGGPSMSIHNQAPERTRTLSVATLGLMVGFALFGARAVSACEMPPLAAVPAAKEAAGKEKEILADVQRYHDAMTAYADCLKKELTAAGGNDAP